MSTYVMNLADQKATLETTGGKGASLARLATAGLPVPGGFHITTDAYRQFVEANNLQPGILAALKSVDTSQPATLETASEAIRQLFMQAAIPTPIADAITKAYTDLNRQSSTTFGRTVNHSMSVAVRSSATAEDLPDASFAGQQDTYLNIRGTEAVLEAVRKCWASLWTARAIGYRARQNIDPESVALAVVVQELVFADAAGIMFTANPMNGSRDEAVINAAWGLGEAIVGGMVTPDTLTVGKAGGRVLKREIANKQVMTIRIDGGTEEQPVPEAKRQAPVLDDRQAAELVQIGARIEGLYGTPMDIEWTLAGGKFAIVQARPITALPEAPIEWKRPNPKGTYMRGSIVDLMPDPVSPLFASMGLPGVIAGVTRIGRTLTRSEPALPRDYFLTINSYAYSGMSFTLKDWRWVLFHLLPSTLRIFRMGIPVWRDEVHPYYQSVVARWQDQAPDKMPVGELWRGIGEVVETATYYIGTLMFATMGSSAGAEMLLTRVYDAFARREGDPPATALLMGWDNIPARSEKSLYDLAMWCRGQEALAAFIRKTPSEELVDVLAGKKPPESVDAGDWQAFHEHFDEHLQRFGYIDYQLDFAQSLPLDHPAPMLETVKMYLRSEGVNPHERQQAGEQKRIQTAETMLGRLKGLKLWAFRKALAVGQTMAEVREDALADIGLGYPLLRRMLHELGGRFAAAGAIEQADDIYWLEKDELETGVAALGSGAALGSLAGSVAERKAFWQRMKQITPPSMIPLKERFMGIKMESFIARSEDEQAGNTLKGVPTSPGKVTAPACVLHGPEDFGRMKPGDVLVAGATTPAWTPLFAMASAVVTDIGGPLSHGSIVAREYGIPAVMGTGVATRRIQSGQRITVDGDAGQVVLGTDTDTDNIQWAPPDPKGVYMRGGVVDLMPGPLSPLFISLGIPSLLRQMLPLGKRMLGSEPVFSKDYYTSVNSYAYMNSSFPARGWLWILFQMLPAYPRLLRMLVPLWRDVLHPEYRAAVARYADRVLGQMSAADLWRDGQALLDAALYYTGGLLFATMGASAGGEGILTQVYNKMAKRDGDPHASTLLMGWNSIPIRAEKSLYDLAMWCRERQDLAAYVLKTPSEKLAAQLADGQSPAQVSPDEWKELQDRFEQHLEQFGYIIFQLDFSEPLPLDHPEPMLENIKMYLRGEGVNPHERQQASEQKRIQTAETMLGRLKGFKRWAFRLALKMGQSMAAIREDALAEIGLAYPMLRRMLRELGRRLVEAGAIEQADDIFWLEKEEVDAGVAALEGGMALTSLADSVTQRKAFQQKMKQITPPPMMPYKERIMGIKTDSFIAHSEDAQTGDTLKGTATSGGKVTAPACVLHGPEDFGRMKPGDVLVAGATTPAWTPLFAMASAVVTDIGGPLSHGSIVAREYGIPAVMGTGVATRRIQSGQVIIVDGDGGTVMLLTEVMHYFVKHALRVR